MNSSTQTQTRTIADVRKVMNSFGADYSMIGQSTGLRSREAVESTTEDLIRYANADYLVEVLLILRDSTGQKLRGRRYTVSNSAGGWTSDDPGDNLWPRTPGGSLRVTAVLSDDYWKLSAEEQKKLEESLGVKGSWPLSTSDNSFTGMTAVRDRQYASNSFGVKRETFS